MSILNNLYFKDTLDDWARNAGSGQFEELMVYLALKMDGNRPVYDTIHDMALKLFKEDDKQGKVFGFSHLSRTEPGLAEVIPMEKNKEIVDKWCSEEYYGIAGWVCNPFGETR